MNSMLLLSTLTIHGRLKNVLVVQQKVYHNIKIKSTIITNYRNYINSHSCKTQVPTAFQYETKFQKY